MKNKKSDIANNLEEIDKMIHEQIYKRPSSTISDFDIAEAVSSALWSNFPCFKEGTSNLQKYRWNNKEHEVFYTGSKYNYGGETGNYGYGLWFWHERFNKPYQKDIEEHVKKWKKPIPKYSSNISLAWEVSNKVKLFDTIILSKNTFPDDSDPAWYTISKIGNDVISMGYTAEEAICRACLVLKAKENESTELSNQQYFSGLSTTGSKE